MNANTALKINDAVDQAVRCGESLEETRDQFERALAQAVRQHRPPLTLDSQAYAYALGIRHDAYLGEVEKSDVKVLHRGCANEAAWFSFTTSDGETYAVEVQRRSAADEAILAAVREIEDA